MTIRLVIMNLLSRREYSFHELFSRLAGKFPEDEITTILEQLKREGLQSDERYAEMRIRVRSQSGYGPLFIENELVKGGIDKDLISSLIESSDIDWVTIASIQKQKRNFKSDIHCKQFLFRKGFENSTIQKVMKQE